MTGAAVTGAAATGAALTGAAGAIGAAGTAGTGSTAPAFLLSSSVKPVSSCMAASVSAASSRASSFADCAESGVDSVIKESFKLEAASAAASDEYGASLDASIPHAKVTSTCRSRVTAIPQHGRLHLRTIRKKDT